MKREQIVLEKHTPFSDPEHMRLISAGYTKEHQEKQLARCKEEEYQALSMAIAPVGKFSSLATSTEDERESLVVVKKQGFNLRKEKGGEVSIHESNNDSAFAKRKS